VTYHHKFSAKHKIQVGTKYALLGKNLRLKIEAYYLGKKKNQTLGLNAKGFFGGGRKIIPLLRDNPV